MGVNTTADEIRDSISDESFKIVTSLRGLKDSLEVMIDSDTWGSEHWSTTFRDEVETDINTLERIISKLGKIKNILDNY